MSVVRRSLDGPFDIDRSPLFTLSRTLQNLQSLPVPADSAQRLPSPEKVVSWCLRDISILEFPHPASAQEVPQVPRPKANNVPILALFFVLFVVSVGFGLIIPLLPLITREYGASAFMLGMMTAGYAVLQFLFAPLSGAALRSHRPEAGAHDRDYRRLALIPLHGPLEELLGPLRRPGDGRIPGIGHDAGRPGPRRGVEHQRQPGERHGLNGRRLRHRLHLRAADRWGALTLGHGGSHVRGRRIRLRQRAPLGRGAARPPPEQKQVQSERRGSTFHHLAQALRGPGAPYYYLAFVIMFTQSSLMTSLALYLTDRFGIGASTIGAIFALNGSIGALVQGVAIGRITGRLGELGTIRAGLLVGAAGYLAIVLAPTLGLAMGAIVMTALSMSLTRPSATSLLSQVTPLPQGITMGVQGSFDSLGRVIGPLWAGFAYDQMHALPFFTAAAALVSASVTCSGRRASTQPDPTRRRRPSEWRKTKGHWSGFVQSLAPAPPFQRVMQRLLR